jgi:hypothetical protein
MEFLAKNDMTVVLHSSYFSLFPPLKMKLKGRHFDTIEVIEAELQAVFNTLTEHDFQDAFKDWQKRWNGSYTRKGTTSRAMVANRPKLDFDQMAAPFPEVMDVSLYVHNYVTTVMEATKQASRMLFSAENATQSK